MEKFIKKILNKLFPYPLYLSLWLWWLVITGIFLMLAFLGGSRGYYLSGQPVQGIAEAVIALKANASVGVLDPRDPLQFEEILPTTSGNVPLPYSLFSMFTPFGIYEVFNIRITLYPGNILPEAPLKTGFLAISIIFILISLFIDQIASIVGITRVWQKVIINLFVLIIITATAEIMLYDKWLSWVFFTRSFGV